MRVLAVSQHYWPEPFAIADVCEGLAAMGHDVTVLTGTPISYDYGMFLKWFDTWPI